MNEEGASGFIGVSLIDEQLRIVEVKKLLNDYQITCISQGSVRQPFDFEIFSDRSCVRRFAEDIERLYSGQAFQSKKTGFALDSRMALIKKIPVDKVISEDTLKDHVYWEVQQFVVSPVHDYVVAFESLHTNTEEPDGFVLVVAVRKKIVDFIREIFSNTELDLQVVDVDIFAAQRALLNNYELQVRERVGLIDVEEREVHVAILEGPNYFLSRDLELSAETNNDTMDSSEESKARLISQQLRQLIVDHELGRSVEDLDEIFLYGEALEDRLLEELQNTHDVRIDRANPFRKVKLSSQAKSVIEERHLERFLVAVGAALRGMPQ